MASVPSGVPPPPSAFATPAAAAAAPAAAIPGAEPATAKPAIDRSPEECNDNASDLWAGASHDTAAVPVTGSTTKHTKLHVAAIFCQKMSPVWAYVTKLHRRGSVRRKERHAACGAETARSVVCAPTTVTRL